MISSLRWMTFGSDASRRLLASGLHFLEAAQRPGLSGTDEWIFQQFQWGLELVLKAYLHAQGWTDARCRTELGHDIALALMACEREGLAPAAPAHRDLIFALSPFSRRHDVAGFIEVHAQDYTSEQATLAARAIARAIASALARP